MKIPYMVMLCLAGFASLVVGGLVLARDWRKIENKAFFGVSIGIILWAVGIAGFIGSHNLHFALIWAKIYYIAPIILVASSVVFAEYFNHRKKVSWLLKAPVLIGGSILSLLIATERYFITHDVITKPFGNEVILDTQNYVIYSIYIISCFVLVISLLFIKLASTRQLLARQQIRKLLIGYLVSCFFGLYFNLILPGLGNYSLIALGPLATAFFLSSTAYAIIKHRLFDIRAVVTRSLAYATTSLALAVVHGFIIFGSMKLIFGLRVPSYALIIISVFMGISGIVFPKLKAVFDRLTNRIFFRDAYDPQELYSQLNAALVSSLDLGYLAQKTSLIITDKLKPSYVQIGLKNSQEDGKYRTFSSHKIDLSSEDTSTIYKLMPGMRQSVLVADYLEGTKGEKIKEILRKSDIAVLVRLTPNTTGQEDLGYLALGPKKSGNPYSSQDAKVLRTVAGEMMIAIQNALHYEEIQQFNVTLQDKVNDATRKLKATNEKLKKMDETKDEFISMASHQLRTPLTSVKGYVSMVLDGDVGPINEQQRELLNQSFQSSQRMSNLISDLLNLSRINTGKFVIENSPVYLPAIIETELQQLREMAQGKNIELKLTVPPTFPTLMLDDGKMHQVIMNLVDNALYYTPPDGKVEVQLVETPHTVEFRVIDTGIGVPREAQKHLFGKMFRAENARRARPDGTGLGLFMVKKVIVEQQGAVTFETEENKGSTFGFRLNKKDHLVPDADAPAPSQLPA